MMFHLGLVFWRVCPLIFVLSTTKNTSLLHDPRQGLIICIIHSLLKTLNLVPEDKITLDLQFNKKIKKKCIKI